MKSHALILVPILILSVLLVTTLHLVTRADRKTNGFSRHFIAPLSSAPQSLDLQVNSYYFAGQSPSKIFLGNQTNPILCLAIDSSLTQSTEILLQPSDSLGRGAFRLTVQPPVIFLCDYATGTVLNALLNSPTLNASLHHDRPFIDVTAMSPSNVAIKTRSENGATVVLSGLSPGGTHPTYNLLEKQIDGIFCTDGIMLFNAQRKEFIYTYFYRNEYFAADTNLTLLRRGRTIDTTTTAKIKVTTISSQDTRTLQSPPLFVNRLAHTYRDNLYIISALVADNEDLATVDSNTVVDIYSLPTNAYQASFYIPDFNDMNVRGMAVSDEFIFTLQGNHLLRYRLATDLLSTPPTTPGHAAPVARFHAPRR